MRWKQGLICLVACLAAANVAGARSGADFIVGNWTRDGDCKDSDVVKRDGAQYRSKIRGQDYVGSVQREGNILKTEFSNDDGNTRRYVYEIINDNRMRVLDLALCDRVHCEQMHVQSFMFVMRCAE